MVIGEIFMSEEKRFIDEIRELTEQYAINYIKGQLREVAKDGYHSYILERPYDEYTEAIEWLKSEGFTVEIDEDKHSYCDYPDVIISW